MFGYIHRLDGALALAYIPAHDGNLPPLRCAYRSHPGDRRRSHPVEGRVCPRWEQRLLHRRRRTFLTQREPAAVAAAYGYRLPALPATPWLALTDADNWADFDWTAPGPLDAVVHPLLARAVWQRAVDQPVAALHAGAVGSPAGSWAVVGPRTQGKSTLLHALHRRGHAILSDDVCIVEDGRVLSGPRCIDLREDVPGSVPVRGDRHRVTLPPVPAATRLAGFIHLRWDPSLDAPQLSALEPAERLAELADPLRQDARPSQAVALLDLATYPAFRLSRPRSADIAEVAALVESRVLAATNPGQVASR